jgi:decaprenylphospho-beta-D-ribofuranose 2-oxidase
METRLPRNRLERVEAWGMSSASMGYVFRPTQIGEIEEAFQWARRARRYVTLKGAGNSYGDAFQCREGVVIDLSRMNRILNWDPVTGIILCEPGVTIEQLWRYVLEDGWWPPVVSGTAKVTLGGAVSANIHGKNNFRAGPLGEHVRSFDLLTPEGRLFHCTPQQHSELFYTAIGGFGLLGVILNIELQLHRVWSGYLKVTAVRTQNWHETFEAFREWEPLADYLVGWIDGFASGSKAGRGLIHGARYLAEGEDPHPEESLKPERQQLPDTFCGILARSQMHRLMKPLVRDLGVRIVNSAKFWLAKREHGHSYLQPLVSFNFLLDSIPNWKLAYKPRALIQYQCFIPKESAPACFERLISLCQERGHPPYLVVMKRHRKDAFLLSHAVDGYSLAMDFPMSFKTQESLLRTCQAMDDIVLENNGRFYFAKDALLHSKTARQFLTEEVITRFLQIKARLDPEALLQSELSKRILGRLSPHSLVEALQEPQPPREEPPPLFSLPLLNAEALELPPPFWKSRETPENS